MTNKQPLKKTLLTVIFLGLTAIIPVNGQTPPATEKPTGNMTDLMKFCSQWEDTNTPDQTKDALKACNQVLENVGDQPEIQLQKGRILLTLKDYSNARTAFGAVIEKGLYLSEAYTYQCYSLIHLGYNELAIEQCEKAINQGDNNWQKLSRAITHNYLGFAYLQLKNWTEAKKALDWSIDLNPDYSEALTYRCWLNYQQQDFYTALKDCNQALKSNRDWGFLNPAKAFDYKGKTEEKLGRYNEALESYNQSIALDANDYLSYSHYGYLLTKIGKYDIAKSTFETAVSLNPTSSYSLLGQCIVLNSLKDFENAFKACETSILKADNQWEDYTPAYAWNQQSRALNGLGRFEEAIIASQRAVTLNSNLAEAWSNRSVAQWNLGRFDEALISSQRAVSVNPKSSIAWYNYGRVLTTLGKFNETLIAYQQALQGDAYDDNPALIADIWTNQSATLYRLGQFKESLESANNAITYRSNSPENWYNQALALLSLNRNYDAINAFTQAITLSPEDQPQTANLWAGKGIAFQNIARYEEAVQAYKKALELNPTQPQALANLAYVEYQLQQQLTPPTISKP